MRNTCLAMACALFVAACGGAGTHSSTGAFTDTQAVGQSMTTTLSGYGTQSATMADVPACTTSYTHYRDAMTGMLDRMAQMSASMDQHMTSTGHGGDMACFAAAMAAEMAQYPALACASADLPTDEQAAATHVEIMLQLMAELRMGYMAAGSSMGMMSPPSATALTCSEDAGGAFVIGGQPWTPGSPLPGLSGTCSGDTCNGLPWPMPCAGMMGCGNGMM
jgi:hypothetical protein